MQPSARIRRAVSADAPEIAEVLRQSFLEFESLYTPKGFAATTPDREQVERRMEEGQLGSRSARIALRGRHLLFLKAKRDCMFAESQLCHPCVDAESRKR